MADNFPRGAVHLSVGSDGTLAYLQGGGAGEQSFVWVDEEGAVVPASRHRRNFVNFPRLSPDGKRVAVVIEADNNLDLWILDLERDLLTLLTFDEAFDTNPVWSPDGRWIYFHSFRGGKRGIYRMQADGTGEAEQLLEAESGVPVRDISPDGNYLAYCPGSGNDIDIFLLPLAEGGSPQAFLADPHGEGSPRFSPDGRWLAYDSNESGTFEVYIRRFPGAGGKVQVSTEGGFRPHWSADGRRLFYRTDDAIWVSNIDVQGEVLQPGKAKRLIDLKGFSNQSFEVADDGKRFLLLQDSEEADPTEVVFVFNWFEELKRLVPTE
jgi:serine/threonine-protein kinase